MALRRAALAALVVVADTTGSNGGGVEGTAGRFADGLAFGAAWPAVTVRPRGAPAVMRITRRGSVRIGGIAPRARGSVVVAGLDVNNRPVTSARARIPRR